VHNAASGTAVVVVVGATVVVGAVVVVAGEGVVVGAAVVGGATVVFGTKVSEPSPQADASSATARPAVSALML